MTNVSTEDHPENYDHALMDDLAAYALGALEPGEIKRIEDLLVSSADARAALEELREGATAFACALPNKEPPPHVRENILERATIYGGSLSVLPSASADVEESPNARSEGGWLERLMKFITPIRAIYAGGAVAIGGLAVLSVSLAVINSDASVNPPQDFSVSSADAPVQINPGVASAGSAFASAIQANSEPFFVFFPSVASEISETANTSAMIAAAADNGGYEGGVEATFRHLPELSEGSKFKVWGIIGDEMELIEEFYPDAYGAAKVKFGKDMEQLREYERIVVTYGGEVVRSRSIWFPKDFGR